MLIPTTCMIYCNAKQLTLNLNSVEFLFLIFLSLDLSEIDLRLKQCNLLITLEICLLFEGVTNSLTDGGKIGWP